MELTLFKAALAFALSFALIKLLKPVSRKIGLVDKPDERKQHKVQYRLVTSRHLKMVGKWLLGLVPKQQWSAHLTGHQQTECHLPANPADTWWQNRSQGSR